MPEKKLINVELTTKEILTKHMKKVMPFVQQVCERVEQLGKAAMAVTVNFDEYEIMTVNLSYLKNTLDLESLEVRFTDDPTAEQKMKEEVRPGVPFIIYTTKPSIKVNFENPVPRSGHFTQSLNVSQGDTIKDLKEKLAKAVNLKEIAAIQIWRFVDPVLGPRKIPAFEDYKSGKALVEEGTVSLDLKTETVYITSSDSQKVEVGNMLVYIVA